MQSGVVLTVAMVLYGAMVIWSGTHSIGAALDDFPFATRGPQIVAAVLLGWALRGLRWSLYTDWLALRVPVREDLFAFAASFAFTATPGKAGEIVKSLLLKIRCGIPMTATAGALLTERLMDLVAVLFLAATGLTLVDGALPYFIASAVLLTALVAFIVLAPLHRRVLGWATRWGRLRRPAVSLLELLTSSRRLLRRLHAAVGLGLALLAWGLEATAFWLILDGLGFTVAPGAAAAVFGISTLVGALSMLPGGLGGFEAAMLLMLTGLGLDSPAAVAATLVLRIATLWMISLLGGLAMALWLLREQRTDGL